MKETCTKIADKLIMNCQILNPGKSMKTFCTKESSLDLAIFEAMDLLEIQCGYSHFFTQQKGVWTSSLYSFCNVKINNVYSLCLYYYESPPPMLAIDD